MVLILKFVHHRVMEANMSVNVSISVIYLKLDSSEMARFLEITSLPINVTNFH